VRSTLSDRFYTPTLIRPDHEREGWVMSHNLNLGCCSVGETRKRVARQGVFPRGR